MHSMNTGLVFLAARVEKLEAQNRRWKLISVVFVVSGLSLMLIGAKPADRVDPTAIRAKTVEAQEFILKDQDGHVYSSLSLNSARPEQAKGLNGQSAAIEGQASLQFFDNQGRVVWTAPTKALILPVK